jgi:hypothetical protein
MINTTDYATPNPSGGAVASAGGLATLIGWGASILAAKYGIPVPVVGAVLGGVATVGTSIWHRFFGPAVPLVK